MKIVFVTTESFIDHSYTIIQELNKHVKLHVFIIAKKENDEIINFCKKTGSVLFLRAKFINPSGIIKTIRLFRKIKEHGADIVWFNTMGVLQLLFVKLYLKNFIVNVHDVSTHPGFKDFHGLVAQKITYAFYKKRVCVMSNTQSEVFKHRFGFYPSVFRLPIINYYSENKNESCQISNDKIKTTKFFFFGSILPYKGIEILLDSAEILENKGIEFNLEIYGKLLYNREFLKARINELKNVKLKDKYIDYKEVNSVYMNNDIIIIPYIHVSQCGPLLIAYNENIPVICNNIPGFREYVDDGYSGLLFDGTASDLADKMNFIMNNKNVLKSYSKFISVEMKKRFLIKFLADNYLINFRKFVNQKMF
jgi:glycosyltransferase involved in cell wall biosynthesis